MSENKEMNDLIKKLEKLEVQLKQLQVKVFELEKGKEASVGPNVPPLPG